MAYALQYINLTESYLETRKLVVQWDGHLSDMCRVVCGVPLGNFRSADRNIHISNLLSIHLIVPFKKHFN